MGSYVKALVLESDAVFYPRVLEYKRLFDEAVKATYAFMEKHGMEKFRYIGGNPAKWFLAPRVERDMKYVFEVPSDWKKPDAQGATTPKKGTQAYKEMLELPVFPSTHDIYRDTDLPYHLVWRDKDGTVRRSTSLVPFNHVEPPVHWLTDVDGNTTFFLSIPPYDEYLPEDFEGLTLEQASVLDFKVPLGLRPLTDKHYKFLVAKNAYELELAEKAELLKRSA